MSTALASRVVWGTGQTAVAVDQVTGGYGLTVAVAPARPWVEIFDGAGDPHYVGGPGSTRVRVTVAGSGLHPPALASLAVPCTVTVYWPDLSTTVLSLASPTGVAARDADLFGGLSGWTWEGVGTVTSGTDPLSR